MPERGTPHLENLIPVGIGEKALAMSGRGLSALRARLFAGAVDAAAVNAVTDPLIQGIEMGAGFRDEFDPIQFASSVALGAVAGGVMGPITHRASSPESHIAGEIAIGQMIGHQICQIVRPICWILLSDLTQWTHPG